MKELSIEQKAQRYDEAIERAKELLEIGLKDTRDKRVVLSFFPELRASEDERIRGAIIDHLKDYNLTEWAAWLEKQGRTFTKKDVDDAYLKGVCNTKQELEKQGENHIVGNNEMVKPIDKVEPRFKVGEWVVYNGKHESVYQIDKIENFQYILRHILGGSMPLSFSYENALRNWDVQDARDGDILQLGKVTAIFKELIDDGVNCRCYCSVYDGEFEIPSQDGIDNSYGCHDATPATKEQRDTLLKAIADAGYTFDFKKKELKKIEQKFNIGDEIKNANEEPLTITKIDEKGYWSKDLLICSFDDAAKWELVEQKPAWSEEDETCLKNAIMYCEWARDKAPDLPCYETSEKSIDWLKSLRPKNRLEANRRAIRVCKEVYADILSAKGFDLGTINSELNRLEEQLKKL